MLEYFIVFGTNGVVHYEEGIKPYFRDSYIMNLKVDTFERKEKVRDVFVNYEIKGGKVYMLFSKSGNIESLAEMRDRYESRNKVHVKQVEEKTPEKKEELDYSTDVITAGEDKDIKTRKLDFIRGFSLFSGKIHVGELYEKMESHLISKNIAPEAAHRFCDAIEHEFSSEWISEKEFKGKLKDILGRFIKSINHKHLLAQIREKNSKGKVFSFCFIGVNGVGKSTSLAKLSCWLLRHRFKVYIAACDTFRAGAVEQLKVHVSRFRAANHDVGFYEKGYNKDDSVVCKDAISMAQKEKYDVVLIDTAGRMHNKKNLMQSLTKLVKRNQPDHVIFVGEALVGSDSLEHLKEFNKAVGEGTDRKIDTILLTKVDTVDDKIGQIVNMTLSAQAPIIFLGTGQSNIDLIDIDIKAIADILMS